MITPATSTPAPTQPTTDRDAAIVEVLARLLTSEHARQTRRAEADDRQRAARA